MLVGLTAALVVSGVWVGLTAWTGKTYHLAPLLAAAAPGLFSWFAADGPIRASIAAASFALGAAAAALGWIAIILLDVEPTAVLVDGQPGGVLGEVVAGALIGAGLGAALLIRRRAAA